LSSISQLQKYFEGKRLVFPILLGLAAAFYFFFKDFDAAAYAEIAWGPKVVFWFVLALIMVGFRLLGYVYRLRILSEQSLSWKKCFQLVVLWEFSSAITPGIVGGTAAAFILLAQEKKLGTGRSTAIVLATSYLDVLFYILAVPAFLVFTGLVSQIPTKVGPIGQNFILVYFLISFVILIAWAVLVYIGIFIRPRWVKALTIGFFRLPFLKRWRHQAKEWGDEIMVAAKQFKLKKRVFWYKAFGATFFSWTARFTLVNFLILAFGTGGAYFLEIFARQLIMWGALLLPLTPGASGLAEMLFPAFLNEYFANDQIANSTAVLWRLISYYPYLFLGIIVFPIWIKRILKSKTTKEV